MKRAGSLSFLLPLLVVHIIVVYWNVSNCRTYDGGGFAPSSSDFAETMALAKMAVKQQLQLQKQAAAQQEQQQQQRRRRTIDEELASSVQRPDAFFNSIPLVLRNNRRKQHENQPLVSSVHCIGETFGNDHPWLYRSCEFENLCLDLTTKEFVLFAPPPSQTRIRKQQINNNGTVIDWMSSSFEKNTVAVGGYIPMVLKKDWRLKKDAARVEWFPKVVDGPLEEPYYQLPSLFDLIPLHVMGGQNPGHVLWDAFLPVYYLLSIFGRLHGEREKRPLIVRYEMDGTPITYSCDYRFVRDQCQKMLRKLIVLMGMKPAWLSTQKSFDFSVVAQQGGNDASSSSQQPPQPPQANYVCSRFGAAGIGALTDHGLKGHGQLPENHISMHNSGRGGLLYQFRDYTLRNIGLNPAELSISRQPYRVLLSVNSTSDKSRRIEDFGAHLTALESIFANRSWEVAFEQLVVHEYPFEEQLHKIATAAVYVTACGGGAFMAQYLSRGATIVVICKDGQFDFDILNNAGYFHIHWLRNTNFMDPENVDIFAELVASELERIKQQVEA